MKIKIMLVATALLAGCGQSDTPRAESPKKEHGYEYKAIPRPIQAKAPGCEIRSPNGDLINKVFMDTPKGITVTIKKGTTFTIDCFAEAVPQDSITVEEK